MFIKAAVIRVDDKSRTCKCRDERDGQVYINVRWMSPVDGEGVAPRQGTRVLLWRDGTGEILIMGRLDYASPEKGYPSSLTDPNWKGTEQGSVGATAGTQTQAHAPNDMLPGDKVFGGKGGGIFASLLSGAALIKASPLCQILVSRIDDVIRLFSRNYEQYSDANSEVSVNVSGKTYSYREVYRSQAESRASQPVFKEMAGSVPTALSGGYRYRTATASDGSVVYAQFAGGAGDPHYSRTVQDDGTETTTTWAGASSSTTVRSTSSTTTTQAGPGGSTVISQTDSQVTMQVNGGSSPSVVMTQGSIVSTCGGTTVTQTDSQVAMQVNGGSSPSVVMTQGSIVSTCGGTTVTQTDSQIILSIGGTSLTLQSAVALMQTATFIVNGNTVLNGFTALNGGLAMNGGGSGTGASINAGSLKFAASNPSGDIELANGVKLGTHRHGTDKQGGGTHSHTTNSVLP